MGFRQPAECGGIAAAAGAEAEVLTHRHQTRLQLPHQHLLHKGLRAEGRQSRRERHQHQLLDAQGLKQVQLLRRQIQAQPRLAVEHLAWVGPEAHHGGHKGTAIKPGGSCRSGNGGGDHAPVPFMQAIKAAESDGGGALGVLGTAEGNHQRTATTLARGILPWQVWATSPLPRPAPWPIASICS